MTLAAEWRDEEREPIGARASRLAVSNLAARERRTVAIADVATASELDDPSLGGRQALLELGSRAALAVPLIAFEHLIGVLAVHRNAPGAWSDREITFVEAVARELAVALHTSQLLADNEQQLARQSALYRIASLLVEPLSLAATLDALAQAAQEAFGAAAAAVLTAHRRSLRLAGAHGLPAQLRAALEERLDAEGDGLAQAAEEQRILASKHLEEDERFSPHWRSLASECGFRSLLVVPLESRGDAAGLVLVFFADERTLRDEDLELARHLAGAGRGALERSELFEAERTSRALAQQLARTGSVLATELDPAAVLDEVVELAPILLATDACAIRVIEGEELVVAAASGEGTELTIGERAPMSGWLAGEVARSRGPIAVEDASVDRAVAGSDTLVGADYAAYLGVPLVGPEGVLHGVLSLYGRGPRVWRAEEIEALLALAATTSAALSNAELYQRVALEKERSAAILENIAEGIVALDRDSEVVLWNKAAEQATGVPASEALGRTTEQVLGRSLAGAAAVPIRRGADEIWLSVTEAVMHDPAGLVAGRIFAFRDISADRSVEEMKSEFVSTVSHELRGPLTSIYGFAETLLRQDVLFGEDERRVFLGYISSESKRLRGIVDALLNVARLDAGDLQVNVAATDLRPLVAEVVSTVEENGGANAHSFVLELPAEPLSAQADADKLRQVLAQLVENAVKFSPNGGRVTVSARRTSDTVEVHVLDEGVGIPAAERERIFRKFYRADQQRGGTGLGLFIAQGLVTAMGGRIWVESAEGEGSRFAFELPAARV
jgi:two-component system phosphate regulon sensor histidine kinase PhoR